MEGFKLNGITKTKNGKYLKNYELNYTNKKGAPKVYEMVSYHELGAPEDIGGNVGGVVILALCGDRLLLLREFRMAINGWVYNLCAGRKEPGESVEDCVRRELYEETGLNLIKIRKIFNPAYAAVAMTDAANQLVIAEVDGEISDNTEDDELIEAALYTKSELAGLLEDGAFTTRSQFVVYSFIHGLFDDKESL